MRNKDIQCIWKGVTPSREDITQILIDHKNWYDATRNRPPLPPHNLSGAFLHIAHLNGASLWHINLSGAHLFNADLSGTVLYGADLSGAYLTFTNLSRAALIAANLDRATLMMTDLSNANVANVRYKGLKSCRSIRAETCYGSPRFRRHVMDMDYIEELRDSKWGWLYWPWLISSNCGRSFSLWILWSVVLIALFAGVFFLLGDAAFKLGPNVEFSFLNMLYYSVVSFTSLGLGGLEPLATAARWWMMAEWLLGYLMLGGLISIFANKFARRAG